MALRQGLFHGFYYAAKGIRSLKEQMHNRGASRSADGIDVVPISGSSSTKCLEVSANVGLEHVNELRTFAPLG